MGDETAMTGTAWLFMLASFAATGFALWMGWMGMCAPHPGFREGGHAPGASGSFKAPSGSPPAPPAGEFTNRVA